jgi:hypothetical protein
MQITAGIQWVITCTAEFEQTVAFFQNTLGLAISDSGIPTADLQFTRFVQFTLPNGSVLEVVEPKEHVRELYTAPIVSFTVDNLPQAQHELEEMHAEIVAPVVSTKDGWAWMYVRAPDGSIYQIQGPL